MQTHSDDSHLSSEFVRKLLGKEDPVADAEQAQNLKMLEADTAFRAEAAQDLEFLETKAAEMTKEGTNEITAGVEGEPFLAEVQGDRIFIRRLPEDSLCFRISIGEGVNIPDSAPWSGQYSADGSPPPPAVVSYQTTIWPLPLLVLCSSSLPSR